MNDYGYKRTYVISSGRIILYTAALAAAVFLLSVNVHARTLEPVAGSLPSYSGSTDRICSDGDIEVEQKGRRITVRRDGEVLWELKK